MVTMLTLTTMEAKVSKITMVTKENVIAMETTTKATKSNMYL
jgi:hypothetical protein